MTVVLDHIHIATEHNSLLFGEILRLTACGHHATVGMHNANIAARGHDTGSVVSGLLVLLDGDQAINTAVLCSNRLNSRCGQQE